MIGHLQILQVRSQGMRPASVFVQAGRTPPPHRYDFEDPEKALACGMHPTVYVLPADMGKHLDLRFLSGLRVHVQADSLSDAVLTLAEKIAEAGALHIIAHGLDAPEIIQYKNGEWTCK